MARRHDTLSANQLRILVDLGWDAHEIAVFADRSVQTIYNRLHMAGLSIKKPSPGRALVKTQGQEVDGRKPVVRSQPTAAAFRSADPFGIAHSSNF